MTGASLSRTDWFCAARWGVFLHFLAARASSSGGEDVDSAAWNRRVDSVDVEALADQIKVAGAGYLFLTLGQNSGHYCSPNATYDRLTGIYPSKCSRRDLVADLAAATEKRGVRLLVYLPSGAPEFDRIAAAKLQWKLNGGRLAEFQCMWEQIIREWSLRWGRKIHGWWMDGCYWMDDMYRHAEPPNFHSLAGAMRAGNPDSIVTWNPGVKYPIVSVDAEEDYTAGEVNEPQEIDCGGRWVGRSQFHMLSYLGHFWGVGPPRFTDSQVIEFTRSTIDFGGVVSWDVPVEENGHIPSQFMRQLVAIGRAVGEFPLPLKNPLKFPPPVMRAKVTVDIVKAPGAATDGKPGEPGQLRIRCANPWPKTVEGRARFWIEPSAAVKFSLAEASYHLNPGQWDESAAIVQVRKALGKDKLVVKFQCGSDPRIFEYPLPVRQTLVLRDLGPCGLSYLPAVLSDDLVRTVQANDLPLAGLRLALAGESLAIAANVVDHRMMVTPLMWDGSCIEVFGATIAGTKISHIFLMPQTAQGLAKAVRLVDGRVEPTTAISLRSTTTETGYELFALVPMVLLGVVAGGEFLLEISITGSLAGDAFQRGTAFGSRNAAADSTSYARITTTANRGDFDELWNAAGGRLVW